MTPVDITLRAWRHSSSQRRVCTLHHLKHANARLAPVCPLQIRDANLTSLPHRPHLTQLPPLVHITTSSTSMADHARPEHIVQRRDARRTTPHHKTGQRALTLALLVSQHEWRLCFGPDSGLDSRGPARIRIRMYTIQRCCSSGRLHRPQDLVRNKLPKVPKLVTATMRSNAC